MLRTSRELGAGALQCWRSLNDAVPQLWRQALLPSTTTTKCRQPIRTKLQRHTGQIFGDEKMRAQPEVLRWGSAATLQPCHTTAKKAVPACLAPAHQQSLAAAARTAASAGGAWRGVKISGQAVCVHGLWRSPRAHIDKAGCPLAARLPAGAGPPAGGSRRGWFHTARRCGG